MEKALLMQELRKRKLVAVIRGKDEEEVQNIVKAVYDGGIRFMEITFTIPKAEQIIAHLCEQYQDCDDIIIGAGTVLDAMTARLAISAEAQFIVCPHMDKDIMKLCNSYRIPCFPGATNVTDMMECLRYGAEIIKLFPGDTFGPKAIKAFKGPLPQADFMPTGGVNAENLLDWLNQGAVAVGTGGSLTKGAATKDFEQVRNEAAKLVRIVETYEG